VKLYLLIDPRKKTVEVFSLNTTGRYELLAMPDRHISLAWGEKCRAEIPFEALFSL